MFSLISKYSDRILRLPELKGFKSEDFDSLRVAQIERKVLSSKAILSTLYDEYCKPCIESALKSSENATMLEIGSGTSILKQKIESLITSDIIWMPWLDVTCSAYSLPFPDRSLDRVFLMFVCHHIGNMETFLREVRRCLKINGEMVIVDPAITIFSKQYYKLHVDNIDINAKDWSFERQGRMSGSNIALTWMVFFRDRDKFLDLFPEFIIKKIEYNTCLTFILSGGFRIRQLLPTYVLKLLFKLENWIIKNISNQFAVTMALTIRRR